jgi:putative N-acetylmannosamine-6-phosphate epimerase
MSIAELIMQGTEQNSKSTAWVSDSLQKIGQNVSAALKEREQQKQAQAMMPFLQQSIQESMELAGKGQSGDAYAKMIPLLTDPSTANNPYIMRVIPALQNGIKIAADDFLRNKQITMMQGYYNQRYGGEVAPSGSERLRSGGTVLPAMANNDSVLNGDVGTDTGYANTPQGRVITVNGEAMPTSEYEETLAAEDTAAQASAAQFARENIPNDVNAIDTANAQNLPTNQVEQPQLSEEAANMAPQIGNFKTLQPVDKQQVLFNATTTQKPKGFESRKIAGLEQLYPDLTGAMLIPEVGTEVRTKRTISTSDKPGSEIKESFSEEITKVGEKLYDFNSKSAELIPAAVNAMIKQAPFDSKKTFAKLFKENGGIENAVIRPTEDPKVYTLFFNENDKDEYTISDTQANNLSIAQTIPALAGSGVQFLGKEKSKEEAAKPQPGLPAVQAGLVAPQIPEEAAQLQQIVQQGQASKAGEQVKATENKIKEIDAEIKQLSATSRQSGSTSMRGMFPSSGATLKSEKQKSPEQAQADIQRIMQLKAQKRILQGKYDTPQEVGDAFASGLLTRAEAESIIKNQFKMK